MKNTGTFALRQGAPMWPSIFITWSKAKRRVSSRDCSSGKSSMECNSGTSGASWGVTAGSSSLSAVSDNLASPLSAAHTSYVPVCRERTPTHCPTTEWNPGQSVPRIRGCVRWELTATFILFFFPLYLISAVTIGYLWISPCTHLIFTQQPSIKAPGRTRFWWIIDCMQPESTIAWCIPPRILTGIR